MLTSDLDLNSRSLEIPLITFAIFVYNQEKYVEEAVKAAFSQTYSPLEIIISDDASTDNSAEIIRGMAKRYHGPHRIVVNINEKNLGIGEHVNKVFKMASADFLILAAGDDISAPDRTRLTVDRWLEKAKRPSMIYCGAEVIDADGNHVGKLDTALPNISRDTSKIIAYRHPRRLLLIGACAAYAKTVISEFGPLMGDLGVEDIPLAIRASQMGGIEFIGKPLLKYRKNVSVWLPRKLQHENFDRHFSRVKHRVRAKYKVSEQILHDLKESIDISAISAAKKRYMSARFSFDSLEGLKFSPWAYIKVSLKTNYWWENFYPAILFGYPQIHRCAFFLMSLIRRGIDGKKL